MSITRLEEEVLEYLKPTPWQVKALESLAEMIRFTARRCLEKRGLRGRVSVEGSFAKGTMLSDKREIDVFILFEEVDDSWVEAESLRVLRECFSIFTLREKHAEHPYVTVEVGELSADIVPARLVESPSQSKLGVSRTPFHTRYVKSRIEKNPRLADEIRLLKSFMKGAGVYGAESGLDGFSGYMAELLVIHYGGFRETLEAVAEWKPPVVVDVEKLGAEEAARRYKGSPLIVVDPVDPARNAAAAVSLEKLARFILASRLYLRSPSRSFFHVFGEKARISTPALLVYCEGDYSARAEAVVLGKLKRVSETVWTALRERGFKPAWRAYGYSEDRAVALVGLESLTLPSLELREGPHIWDSVDRALAFIRKRLREGGYAWVGLDGRLYGLRLRAADRASLILHEVSSKVSRVLADKCTVEVCEDSWRCLRDTGLTAKSLAEYPLYAWMSAASTA